MTEAKYVFNGLVFPERTDLNIQPISISTEIDSYRVSISRSKLHAVVTDRGQQEIADLQNFLFTLANNLVNYAGFEYALGYTVHLESCVNLQTEEVEIFGIAGRQFNNSVPIRAGSAFKVKDREELALPIVALRDRYFCRATQELRNSIRYPDYTAMHCQFAIEAIKNSFGEKSAASFQTMLQKLKLKKVTVQKYKQVSAEQKHGRNRYQSWRKELMRCKSHGRWYIATS